MSYGRRVGRKRRVEKWVEKSESRRRKSGTTLGETRKKKKGKKPKKPFKEDKVFAPSRLSWRGGREGVLCNKRGEKKGLGRKGQREGCGSELPIDLGF